MHQTSDWKQHRAEQEETDDQAKAAAGYSEINEGELEILRAFTANEASDIQYQNSVKSVSIDVRKKQTELP